VQTVAFFLLLACVVARPFMAEMTYEQPSAIKNLRAEMSQEERQPDRNDLSRSVFAMLTLLAAGLWTLGAGLSRGAGVSPASGRAVGIVLAVFIVLAAVSVAAASNKRMAMTGWLEQSTLLLTGVLAMRMCCARWRFVVVLVTLVALAFTMSAKGLWEYFVEIPIRITQWETQQAEILQAMGVGADSPQAIAAQARWTEKTPLGFGALSNVFASLLLVLLLAVAGAAMAKFNQARAVLPAFRATRKPGELPVEVVLAAAVAALMVPLAAVLVLTRSRGGIVSVVLALAAFAVVYRFREALAVRWKKALLAAGGVFVALLLAVVVYGTVRDELPSKTMTFRWWYWTATARMIAEGPLTGIGAGNFGAAYLTVRDVRGEEAVKNPHNVIVHAMAEFGVPAGLAFLGVIGVMLVLAARPRDAGVPPLPGRGVGLASSVDKPHGTHSAGEPALRSLGEAGTPAPRLLPPSVLWWLLAATVPAVLMARAYFSFSPGLSDAVFWLVIFVGGLAAAFFALRSLADPVADLSTVRIGLGMAGAAFVLHDLINFAFFQPATAAVFWLATGAAAARGEGVSPSRLAGILPASGCDTGVTSSADKPHGAHSAGEMPAPRCGRSAHATLVLAALFFAWMLAALVMQVLPVWQRTAATGRMLEAWQDRDSRQTFAWAQRAAEADALDPVAAADGAKLFLGAALNMSDTPGPEGTLSPAADMMRRALRLADQAVARDPRHAKYHLLRANALGDDPSAVDDWQRAVDLDPQNGRMRVEFATWLSWAEPADLARALEQLQQADRIDAVMVAAESNERFNESDRARLDALLTAARQATAGVRRHDAQAIEAAAESLKTVAPRQAEQLRMLAEMMKRPRTGKPNHEP